MARTAQRQVALIVEDDPNVRELFAVLLEESDLVVLQTESAEEAIELLEDWSSQVVLVLADIGLPGRIDGLTLSRWVHRRWPEISLIVTSGSFGNAQGLPVGAEFLPKPCPGLDVLMATERAVLRAG